MKARQILAVLVVVAAAASARASIKFWDCAPDNDGAVQNCAPTLDGNADSGYALRIDETLTSDPGHVLGEFQTDSITDPTVTFDVNVTNSTGYAWSGYQFNMYMDQPFTSSPGTAPSGWTTSATSFPTGSYTDSQGNPFTDMATITFSNVSGSDVAPGDSATFGSAVSFSGFFLYTFELEQIASPVTASPEPATLALLALGGLALLPRRRTVR